MILKSYSANEVWLQTVNEIISKGEAVSPQLSTGANGRVSFEIMAHTLCFEMAKPIVTIKPNTSWLYMAAEAMWVLAGQNSLYFCQEIQRIQAPYSDDGKKLAGAYGPPFKSQLNYIVNLFIKDKNTRQAVMTIWRKSPAPSKDIPCTVAIQWLIRDDKLNAIVTMRSSDVGMGLPYDMLTFTCMTAEIASILGVDLGYCYITAGSRHIYENQITSLKNVSKSTTINKLNACYDKWETWKWPAIKERLSEAAKLTWTTEFERAEAQLKAMQLILGDTYEPA